MAQQFVCDKCGCVVDGTCDYLYIEEYSLYINDDELNDSSLIFCSKKCVIDWINEIWSR